MKNSNRSPRTIEQASTDLGVSPHAVRAWVTQRRIGHIRLGRAIRIPAEEIDRVLRVGFKPAENALVRQ